LDRGSKDRDFGIMFERKGEGSIGKCTRFKEFKLRRVKIKDRVAFWGDLFITKLLLTVY